MSTSVCVVGSIHMDLVVHAQRFARPGETLLGGAFDMHPGGKGANQAVAASRMGAQVSLVGCVGEDDWGSKMRGVLTAEGVDIQRVRTCEKSHTGVGVVTVVADGANTIVVASGANLRCSPEDVDNAAGAIGDADVLILQAELPLETNLRAMEIARNAGTRILFNAAPAEDLSPDVLSGVDLLVVNRGEAAALVGDDTGEVSPKGLARRLASFGPERVVVTLGAEGAVHFDGEDMRTFEAFDVECVDATGSGDAFVGALATLRAEGVPSKEAVKAACAAGALAATRAGAIASLPTREEVEELLGSSCRARGN
ncbi:MAG TPA: ribokinase [Planctomycetes bacterium]|nr:ribokinase [Planctomycetota bacterium]